jgi:hypothetical protein
MYPKQKNNVSNLDDREMIIEILFLMNKQKKFEEKYFYSSRKINFVF